MSKWAHTCTYSMSRNAHKNKNGKTLPIINFDVFGQIWQFWQNLVKITKLCKCTDGYCGGTFGKTDSGSQNDEKVLHKIGNAQSRNFCHPESSSFPVALTPSWRLTSVNNVLRKISCSYVHHAGIKSAHLVVLHNVTKELVPTV